VVTDISATLEKKLASVRCYGSQFPPERSYVFDRIRDFAIQQGRAAGFDAGELFFSPHTMGTRDLMRTISLQDSS
jgi:hypothetical protein